MMLIKFVLLYFCAALVSSLPAPETRIEAQMVRSSPNQQEWIINELLKVVEDLKLAYQRTTIQASSFKEKAIETHHVLSSFPKNCTQGFLEAIDIEKEKAFTKYLNCSVLSVLESIGELVLDTSLYIMQVSKDGALIASGFAQCYGSFNPFTILYCIYEEFVNLPGEIRDIIVLTEDYKNNFETLYPVIVHGLESCFNKTSNEYDMYLEGILQKAKLCEGNFN